MKFKKLLTLFFIFLFLFTNLGVVYCTCQCSDFNKSEVNTTTKVRVSNGNMSVCIKGSGKKTIVLLSGLGTVNPIKDFDKLSDELSRRFKVVTIECFGYGESDDTIKMRTSENIIEEVRAALKELDIVPPYILMPHSISGIYSLWYAKNYPDEVEAIVGIDISKPNLQKEIFGSHENCVKYAKENMDQKEVSTAVFNEATMFYKNSEEFFEAKYPDNLPVLSFISQENIEYVKNLQVKNELTRWDILAQNMISNPAIQKNKILSGSHYLHHEMFHTIARMT